ALLVHNEDADPHGVRVTHRQARAEPLPDVARLRQLRGGRRPDVAVPVTQPPPRPALHGWPARPLAVLNACRAWWQGSSPSSAGGWWGGSSPSPSAPRPGP